MAQALSLQHLMKRKPGNVANLRPLTKSRGLSLGDRACLALAMSTGATAVTADRSWADLGLAVSIEVIR